MIKTLFAVILYSLSTVAVANETISGRWLDYFNEGDSYVINGGVQVTTKEDKVKVGSYLKTGLWRWNLQDSTITFKIRSSNWNNTFITSLIVTDVGLKFQSSATLDIKSRLVNPHDNEWIEVTVPASAWEHEGTINWSKINAILLSVADNGSGRAVVGIKDIKFVTNINNTGIVSITFDDGMIDMMWAQKEMSVYGYKGTAFLHVNSINKPEFVNDKDITLLSKEGWDIGGHHMLPLPILREQDLVDHLNNTAEYIKKHNTTMLYSLPEGATNEHINELLSAKFSYIFNINGMANSASYFTTTMNRYSVDKYTTLEQVKNWIDNTKKGEWVIINFHTFSDNRVRVLNQDWTLTQFKEMLQYLRDNNVRVETISKVLQHGNY